MAKGIVKGISSTPTPVRTVTTVEYDQHTVTHDSNYDGTRPVGGIVTGFITDSQSNIDIPFEQAMGAEAGIVLDGLKVSYKTVTINGQVIANCVKLLERGVIETINATNDGGTLKDRATKQIIPFAQLYCKEMGLVAPSAGVKGSSVSFERVTNPNSAAYTAICIEL